MANGKSQITDIDISSISVNLTDYLDNITPYEGFIQCNSPWIGGLLNNVYKRKINLPEGHKLIRMHNGNMYTMVGEKLYKNGIEVATVDTNSISRDKYEDPYVSEGENNITVRYGGTTTEMKLPLNYNYQYTIAGDGTFTITVAPGASSSWAQFASGASSRTITSSGNVTTKLGVNADIVIGNNISSVTAMQTGFSSKGITSNVVHIQYDGSGMIVEDTNNICALHYTFRNGHYDFDYDFSSNICKSAEVAFWTKGEKLYTSSKFNTLYYRKFISGISYEDSVLTYDVDRIIQVFSDSIIYADPSGNKWRLSVSHNTEVKYNVDDDYIYFNTTSYANTYSFKEDKMFCRSDDYNDRVLISGATGDKGLCISSYKANAQVMNYSGFATVYPEVSYNIGGVFKKLSVQDLNKHPIEIWSPVEAGGAAYYQQTVTFAEGSTTSYDTSREASLEATYYPISSDGNTLYNTPMLMVISDTYINEKVGSIGDYTYILAKSQRQENICGYYEFTLSEIKNVFITQGSFYGVTDRYIFDLSVINSQLQINRVVTNKLDLVFLGAFPNMALFYSKLDKSLYSFTGDAILSKVKEAYRINQVYYAYCDPSRLTMIISTDIGTLVFYQNQTFLLDYIHTKDEIYYDNNTYIIGDTFLSLSYKKDYGIAPITLQTEFYGLGSGIKSVNDCVYIRLAKNDIKKGFLKVTSYCLNEKTVESSIKTYDIIDSMFDKITDSLMIRYQPQNQSGVGFSVKIESTNPIISLSIGHTSEAVQNSKFNF